MGTLDAKQRNALPSSDFAGPNRTYPIEDRAHALNALARVHQQNNAKLTAEVDAAVYKKYPDLKSSP